MATFPSRIFDAFAVTFAAMDFSPQPRLTTFRDAIIWDFSSARQVKPVARGNRAAYI
jgi:hypothetical protein